MRFFTKLAVLFLCVVVLEVIIVDIPYHTKLSQMPNFEEVLVMRLILIIGTAFHPATDEIVSESFRDLLYTHCLSFFQSD